MKIDDWIKIITLIISVVATINTFSKLEKSTKLSEDYFEKALSTYAKEYKCNKNINALKFIKRRFDINDYFIPSYVFYLVDSGDKAKLHKILMIDYREKFPSKSNSTFNGFLNIGILILAIIVFIFYLVVITIITITVPLVIYLILEIAFSGKLDMDSIWIIVRLILICIVAIIFIRASKKTLESEYTMKNKSIKKIIERKENEFDKSKDYYIS